MRLPRATARSRQGAPATRVSTAWQPPFALSARQNASRSNRSDRNKGASTPLAESGGGQAPRL